MTAWIARLAPYVLIAALAGAVWLQHREIVAQGETLAGYRQMLDQARAQMQTAVDTAERNAKSLTALQLTQNGLRATLSQREADIGALQRENAEIRAWADTVLPADIARMRTHPALTGANAYAQYLSGRDAVRAAGDGADPKRGSEPRP